MKEESQHEGLFNQGFVKLILQSAQFTDENTLEENVLDHLREINVNMSGLTLLQHGLQIMKTTTISSDGAGLLPALKANVLAEFMSVMLQGCNSAPGFKSNEPRELDTSIIGNDSDSDKELVSSFKIEEDLSDFGLEITKQVSSQDSARQDSPQKKKVFRLQKLKSCPACTRQFCGIQLYPKSFLRHIQTHHKSDAERVLRQYTENMTIGFR